MDATRHVVRMCKLPDGVEFPPELQHRIAFDPVKHQLVFRGFMCKADYDRLACLHTDMDYRRAIERLFQISTQADSARLRWLRWLVGGAFAVFWSVQVLGRF